MIAIIVVGVVLLSFLISHLFVIRYIFLRFYGRKSVKLIEEDVLKDPKYAPYINEMNEVRNELLQKEHQLIHIKSFDGLDLAGRYYDVGGDSTVIMFHGVHTIALYNFGIVTKKLLENGINALVVDQRAHDMSEGKYLSYGKNEQKDVQSWFEYVEQNTSAKNIFLYGISMGGASVACASKNIKSTKFKGLIVDSAYTTVGKLINHLISSQKIPSFLFLGGVNFLAKHLVKMNDTDVNAPEALSQCSVPVLFIHGTTDVVVTTDFLMDNYNACHSSKEELLVEGAGHTLAMIAGGEEAFNKFINFLRSNI